MDLNPGLPRALSRIIRRCLEKDPENRYQSAKDLRSDLRDLLQDLSSGDVATPVRAPVRRRRRAGLLIAAAVAGALFALAGWLARPYFAGAPPDVVPDRVVRLTTDPGIEASPSLSPDGRWIAFSRRNEGRSDVYLQAVGGEKAINLTAEVEGGADQPAFSSDGERIAFATPITGGLFVMGRTGELVRRVSDSGFNPAWSPDGESLVFSSRATGDFPTAHPGGAELWTVSLRNGQKRRLETQDALQPVWSPNGNWIAYWGVDPATRQRDLWVIPARGGTPTRITSDEAADGSPAWSPAGDFLFFSSDRGGTTNLWKLPIDPATGGPRGEIEPVIVPATVAVHPSIAADGKRLAYASYTWAATVYTVGFDPATLETQGPQRTVIAGGLHLWSGARVSADGTQIALVRWGHQHDLFVVRSDGSGLRRLTDDGQGVRCPDWSPDGRHIAFGRTVQTDGSLVVIEVETGKMTPALGLPKGVVGCPSWSPDGSRIVTTLGGGDPGAYVLRWGPSGFSTVAERLPAAREGEFAPRSWSPDGQSLAGTIGSRLTIFSLSNKTYRIVTDAGVTALASYTAWLPDGRHVLFQGRTLTDLWIADLSARTVKRVLSVAPQLIRGASITRDGTRLVVSAGQEEGDIWMANLLESR
jgi:Tol biopolymer transport system component